jgi:hypothetical protein
VTGLFRKGRLGQVTGYVLATLDRNHAIVGPVQYECWHVRNDTSRLNASPNVMTVIGLGDAHVFAVGVGANGVLERNVILVHGHLQKGFSKWALEALQEYHAQLHDSLSSIGLGQVAVADGRAQQDASRQSPEIGVQSRRQQDAGACE